jgi:hypothetical protein
MALVAVRRGPFQLAFAMSPRSLAFAGSLLGTGVVLVCVLPWGCSSRTCDETDTCAPEADASSLGDGVPTGSFCAHQTDASFCQDFDTGDAGVIGATIQNGAAIFIAAEDAAPSPPNALQVLLPAVTQGGSALANYTAFDAGSPTLLRLSFRMRLEYSEPGGGAALVGLSRANDAKPYQLYLDADPNPPGHLSLDEQGADFTIHPFGRAIDFTQWHTYELSISYEAGKAYTLSVDGVSETGELAVGRDSAPFRLIPSAGVSSRPATGPQHVHFDNIVLYTTP